VVRTDLGRRQATGCERDLDHFSIHLSATDRGARLAVEQLHVWGWPYDTDVNHTAALLVAELAANAVRHGRVKVRDFRLSLYRDNPAALRIELTNARIDRRPPIPGTLPPAPPRRIPGVVCSTSRRWPATGRRVRGLTHQDGPA
jgi:hypothetical protein